MIQNKLFIVTRIFLVVAVCIIVASCIGIFYIVFGQFYKVFGSVMMGLGIALIILGGAMGAGGWYKAYNTAWMRAQKEAMGAEMETYHKDRCEYTIYGFFLAIAGLLALIIGLFAFVI